ncbi:hypothetical protein Btru_009770 [Bulinus truncatus]|nr:hypothetical protein Btru_009770 [Bulinus truncatus]
MRQAVAIAVALNPATSMHSTSAIEADALYEQSETWDTAESIRKNSASVNAVVLDPISSTYITSVVKSIPLAELLMMSHTTTTTSSTNNSTVRINLIEASNQIQDIKSRVSCVATPFVECELPVPRSSKTSNVTFGVALLRQPSWIPDSQFNFKECPYSNCVYHGAQVTRSTKLVVVNVVNLNEHYRPPHRWPHQIYMACTYESPVHTHASFQLDANSVWNLAFNLTATYRLDSDLFLPYGKLIFNPGSQGKMPNYYEIAKKKKKMAVWIVSHCEADSGRDEYVKQMQKFIDVDIFGECGKTCPESGTMCSADIPLNYRYYLSFENSLCEDYVTEKFFKMFRADNHIIPVVRGSFDYNQHMPRDTFINAADFKSAADLAEFLKHLADDNVSYGRYLEVKDAYRYVHYLSKEIVDKFSVASLGYGRAQSSQYESGHSIRIWAKYQNLGKVSKSRQSIRIWAQYQNLDKVSESGHSIRIWAKYQNLGTVSESEQSIRIWAQYQNLDKVSESEQSIRIFAKKSESHSYLTHIYIDTTGKKLSLY